MPADAGAAAGKSLGEAYKVSDRLGGTAGASLRHAARHAFVHGMHITLVVSAALLLLGAVAALRLPRRMECAARHTTSSAAGVPAPREHAMATVEASR